jgi:hypothetical protein
MPLDCLKSLKLTRVVRLGHTDQALRVLPSVVRQPFAAPNAPAIHATPQPAPAAPATRRSAACGGGSAWLVFCQSASDQAKLIPLITAYGCHVATTNSAKHIPAVLIEKDILWDFQIANVGDDLSYRLLEIDVNVHTLQWQKEAAAGI